MFGVHADIGDRRAHQQRPTAGNRYRRDAGAVTSKSGCYRAPIVVPAGPAKAALAVVVAGPLFTDTPGYSHHLGRSASLVRVATPMRIWFWRRDACWRGAEDRAAGAALSRRRKRPGSAIRVGDHAPGDRPADEAAGRKHCRGRL